VHLETISRAAPDVALEVAGRALDGAALAGACGALAADLAGASRVAVWAQPSLETCVAVCAALVAGVPAVPVNPQSGTRELAHVLADAAPDALLAAPGDAVPAAADGIARLDVDVTRRAPLAPDVAPAAAPGLIVYTSGTTGPPKGVVLSRGALEANLAALADAWGWTAADTVVQALPLYHVHGLVLGILGPLRLGGAALHVGRFAPEAIAAALRRAGTMLFGVPTMYGRLVEAAEADAGIAAALGGARLLVSGSAPLPARLHERCARVTGQRIVERYGMSEALMICSVRADGDRRPGHVGVPLPGVDLRLVDDAGAPVDVRDSETLGEVEIRSPSLFSEYLNRPDATREAFRDGWFRTGDIATRAADGYVRIVGRRSSDLIKSGGYRIGAGEIEAALAEHPAIAEAAVTAEPDDDLGERIVAWVVVREGADLDAAAVATHVGALLSPHKRPRDVRFVDALPRNALGKVQKSRLRADRKETA
jgi:malonyl-CoA/methylmalonyl-CoA synthetase